MSVLETFYILFKSDTSGVDKGIEKVSASIKNLGSHLVKTAAAFVAINSVFSQVGSALSYGIQIGQASQALQVNAESLDMWGNAVKKTGGTVEGFQASILSLAEHTGTTVPVALRLLPKLADAFHRMGQMQALKYGKLIGLDTPTILLLQQGRREVDAILARQKELGTVTQQDALAFAKFSYELSNTGHGVRSLFLELIASALPFIDKFLVAFQDMTIYLRKHSNLIVGALIPVAVVLGVIATEAVIASWPIYALVAAFLALSAAVALVYDDIKGFLAGNNSVTGELLKKWQHAGPIIKSIIYSIRDAFLVMLGPLGNLISLLEKIKGYLPEGKNILSFAGSTPLSAQTTSSILNNSKQNNTNNVGIQSITINTQATDAKGISYGLGSELQRQLDQAYNTANDGGLI